MSEDNKKHIFFADKIMSELITDVAQRWQLMDSYKRNVGTGITFSQTSPKYQNFIISGLCNDISRTKGISTSDARIELENFIKEDVVISYITQNQSEEGKQLFAVKSQIRSETDTARKNMLQQEYDTMLNKIFEQLPPAEKTHLKDNCIAKQIVLKHAKMKAQAEMGATEKGYCLKGITESLYKIESKYGLEFLPPNTFENTTPETFIQNLLRKDKNADKHIFHTEENLTFRQIAEQNNIRSGAIVILDDAHGKPRHAMFLTDKHDKNGEPLLTSFNGLGAEEESNVPLSFAKNGKQRSGTIIDIGAMVAENINKRYSQLMREGIHRREAMTAVCHQHPDKMKLLQEDSQLQKIADNKIEISPANRKIAELREKIFERKNMSEDIRFDIAKTKADDYGRTPETGKEAGGPQSQLGIRDIKRLKDDFVR